MLIILLPCVMCTPGMHHQCAIHEPSQVVTSHGAKGIPHGDLKAEQEISQTSLQSIGSLLACCEYNMKFIV